MSATVKLESIRYVKRVSNGGSLSKYGYIGMMESLADAIKTSPWVKSNAAAESVTLTTNKLTKTDGVWNAETGEWTTKPTYTAYTSDQYDVFNQAGDAISADATMCGYAGCVAYRFKLPTSETANALNSISLSLQRDRYLRAGVRVGLALSDSDMPSEEWSVVRGDATGCVRSESTAPAEGVVGVASFGFLGQPDVPYLTSSRAASGVITFDTSTAFEAAASFQYLYLYITLEDPTAYWDLYNDSQQRQYYIEGSAMLVADNCTFTFANAPASATPEELVVGYGTPDRVTYYNGSVPDDLKPHPYAATDLTFRSTCGAPAAVTNSGSTTFDVNDFTVSSTLTAIGVGDPKEVAVKDIYAQFYKDNFVRCPAIGPYSFDPATPAASFCVAIQNNIVVMIRKKLLVPFTVPAAFRPTKVRVDWRSYGGETNYTSLATVNLRHSIWIAKGSLSNNYSLEALQKHELYTAERDALGSFKLVGTFFHLVESASSEDPDFSATFDLPYKIDRGPYTFLLTVFMDQDMITYDTDGVMTTGFFGNMNMGVRESGIIGYAKGALPSGWSPTITLIS